MLLAAICSAVTASLAKCLLSMLCGFMWDAEMASSAIFSCYGTFTDFGRSDCILCKLGAMDALISEMSGFYGAGCDFVSLNRLVFKQVGCHEKLLKMTCGNSPIRDFVANYGVVCQLLRGYTAILDLAGIHGTVSKLARR